MAVDLKKLARRIIETEELLKQWRDLTGATDADLKQMRATLMSRARTSGIPMPTLARELVAEAQHALRGDQ